MATEPNNSPAPPPKKRKSGVVVPNAPKWHQRLGARLVFLLVRGVALTLRYKWDDRSGFFDVPPAGQAIYAVWHNRLALCLVEYYGYPRKRNNTPGMAALVSASKDGAFLAAILKAFGVQPVRGSSSRRGAQALIELTSWAERGYDLAITPDGPRGPRYVVQEGALALAQVTGLPIIPASYSLSWKLRMNSWDRFIVPLPFARCEMVFGKPIRVPREASDTEREALRKQFEDELKTISRD
ncbi:MAG: lysophospholipid acyltransferase family protein [Verrucomicrobiota bacterium]|mgnify:CR=1 FL=1